MDKYISAEVVREYLKRVIFGADQKIDRWVDQMPAADVRPAGRDAGEPCTKEKTSTISEKTAYRRSAISHVIGERLRQITLFGDQSWLPLQAWPAILGEEFGELCEAILETCAENGRHPERGGPQNIYREACQVAAVAVQLMEIMEPEISRVPVHPAGEQCLTLREETEDGRCKGGFEMIVYIAGKMTGLPGKGRAEFYQVEQELREKGHVVLNPARLPDGLPPHSYMPICLAMLQQAEAIYMLDNWKDSPGAKLEFDFARYQGKTILFDSDRETRSLR